MFNLTKKQEIRSQIDSIRPIATVLHTYRHIVTGMTQRSYSNPDVRFWVEIA